MRSNIAFNLFGSGPGGIDDDEKFICESDELLVALSCILLLPFSLQVVVVADVVVVVVDVVAVVSDDDFHIFTESIFSKKNDDYYFQDE